MPYTIKGGFTIRPGHTKELMDTLKKEGIPIRMPFIPKSKKELEKLCIDKPKENLVEVKGHMKDVIPGPGELVKKIKKYTRRKPRKRKK